MTSAVPSIRDLTRGRIAIAIAIAVLSFLVYLWAALLLHQQNQGGGAYNIERSSLAAAVSSALYGAPLGAVFDEISRSFLTVGTPIDILIDRLAAGATPSRLAPVVHDGTGLGYVVFATLAMHIFGTRLSALIWFYFVFVAISALAFLWRFRDGRLIAFSLYFSSLTIMLFTPLASDSKIFEQFPTGGIRYFSLLGILPALHIFLDIVDTRNRNIPDRWPDIVLPGIQVIILVLAIIVRGSTGVTMVALALTGAITAWIHRHDAVVFRRTLFKGAYIALLTAVIIGAVMLSFRNYVREGRVGSVFWHRVFISLSFHPEWPFGDMQDRYKCTKYIEKGLRERGDRSGHCVWLHYGMEQNMPENKLIEGVYGKQYERALKRAFFEVLQTYPRQVLEMFVWYKPGLIAHSLKKDLTFNLSGFSNLQIFLLVTSIGIALLCGISSSVWLWSPVFNLLAGATMMFAAVSTIPYFVAWAFPVTVTDLLFFCLFALGLVTSVTIATIFRSLRLRNPDHGAV
jgi:hypothetical protein